MEDQGKRLLLAVALAFGIMLLWQLIFPTETPEKKPKGPEQTSSETTGDQAGADKTAETPETPQRNVELADPGAGTTDDVAAPHDAAMPVAAANPCADEDAKDPLVFQYPAFSAEFSRCGGTLAYWHLEGSRFLVNVKGKAQPMNLVPTGSKVELRPFAVRFEDVDWDPYANWKAEKKSDTEITFTWEYQVEDATGAPRTAFELTKEYKLHPDDYLVSLSIFVVNKASKDERQTLVLSLFGYQDPKADTEGGWTNVDTAWRSSCYVGDSESKASVGRLTEGPKMREARNLSWGGFAHSYFLVATAPKKTESDTLHDCNSYGVDMDGHPGAMRTDIVFPTSKIALGDHSDYHMVTYLGPKYLDKLDAISGVAGFDTGFDEAIDLGWFTFLARPMLWLLQWFYSFLGNWGLAIIGLTLLVKLATLYWTNKSMRSMKAMAKLSPQVKELQAKYKDDKQRLQQETMNLYRSHNVNPLAGCLPILLQMPIWIALYRMLMYAAELYHAPLVSGWIEDLTSTDPYYILPSALFIVMFVQAKLTPSTSDNMQQKMMQYGMPLMFGVMSFFFPAGLTLYIFTNTCLTALHHLWMRRNDPKKGDVVPSGDREAPSGATTQSSVGSRTRGRKGKGKGKAAARTSGRKSSTAGAKKASNADKTAAESADELADEDTGEDTESSESDDVQDEEDEATASDGDEPTEQTNSSNSNSRGSKSRKKSGSKRKGGKSKRGNKS